MLNQSILVGRIDSIESKTLKDKKVTEVELAVQRSFKNQDGEYEIDYIKCILYNVVAENTALYVKKGDLIGVKGRLRRKDKKSPLELVAEKVTFLSSKSEAKE